MFSGPDFLYADAFFPRATTYVRAQLVASNGELKALTSPLWWPPSQKQRRFAAG